MDSVNEELFEEVFRDIAPVSEELAEDPFVKVYVFQGSSVVHVARSEEKIKQFPLVIDDQMSSTLPGVRRKPEQFSLVLNGQVEFEAIEPPKRAFPFPGTNSLKVLCCFSLLIWQLRMGVESIKDMPVHCPKAFIFRKTASGIQTFRSNSTNRL